MKSATIEKLSIPIPEAKQVTLKSYWLTTGEIRFDASYYTIEASITQRILKETGYPLIDLGEFTKDIFYPPRAKRYYANKFTGTPYLTSSTVQWFLRKPDYIIANKLPNIDNWYVKEGWILLTRSGTVGLPIIATKDLEKYILSEHLIRIVPKEDTLSGYLYAYLWSWFGQTYIAKEIFGGVVEEVEPHHIFSIPVPQLPKEIQKIVHENMIKVSEIREKARQMLEDAECSLFNELGLPELEPSLDSKTFPVKSTEMDLRFDASYHNPILRTIRNRLRDAKGTLKRLDDADVSKRIFIPNRFKRAYVEKEFGVPFLSGTNILQIKPHLKFISKGTCHLEDYLLDKGMILIAARGTIGRLMPVTESISEWAASDNIARLVPNKVDYGFLTCFLNSVYGQTQLIGQSAGSMVNLIQPEHIAEVEVPVPSNDSQKLIGQIVVDAYELKELSNKIEDETVKTLETILKEHKRIEVNEKYLCEVNDYADSLLLIANDEFRKCRKKLGKEETISLEEFKKEHGL